MSKRLSFMKYPKALKPLLDFSAAMHESGLEAPLVELVLMRVSQINGCAYCIDMHSRDLLKGGLAVDKLVLVPAWREAGDLFTQREKAALRWAETVTGVADTAVPDEEFAAVSMEFGEKELADLTIAIGLMNALNRMAISFRTTPAAAAFDQKQLADLTIAIGLMNAYNRMAISFRVPPAAAKP